MGGLVVTWFCRLHRGSLWVGFRPAPNILERTRPQYIIREHAHLESFCFVLLYMARKHRNGVFMLNSTSKSRMLQSRCGTLRLCSKRWCGPALTLGLRINELSKLLSLVHTQCGRTNQSTLAERTFNSDWCVDGQKEYQNIKNTHSDVTDKNSRQTEQRRNVDV